LSSFIQIIAHSQSI
jgi:hypothetical protein